LFFWGWGGRGKISPFFPLSFFPLFFFPSLPVGLLVGEGEGDNFLLFFFFLSFFSPLFPLLSVGFWFERGKGDISFSFPFFFFPFPFPLCLRWFVFFFGEKEEN